MKFKFSTISVGLLVSGFILSLVPNESLRAVGTLTVLPGCFLSINASIGRRLIGALVGAALLSVPAAAVWPSTRSPQPTLVHTAAAADKRNNATEKPAEPTTESVIPGLAAVDVTKNLTDRGYTCGEMRREQSGASWTCKKGDDHIVTVVGFAPTRIEYVSATVLDNVAEAPHALGFIATIPFDGNEPERAREWVRQNIRAGGTQRFGTIEFRLSADTPTGRTLSISPPGSRYFR